MKFLSPLLFFALMAWSWNAYKDTSELPVLTHMQLQVEVKNFIVDYIKKNVAGVTEIRFARIWTEPTESNAVRVVFEYSFDISDTEKKEDTTQLLKGLAYLSPGEGSDQWSLDRVEINDQVLEFKNGTIVGPDKSNN